MVKKVAIHHRSIRQQARRRVTPPFSTDTIHNFPSYTRMTCNLAYPPQRTPLNRNFIRNRHGIIRTDTYCSLCDLPPPHSHRLTIWPRPSGSSSGERIVSRHFIIATFSKLQDYDMTNVTLLIIPSTTCRPSTLRRPKSSRCADPRQTKTRYVPRPPSPLSTLSPPPIFSSQSSASTNWTTRARF